MYRDEDGGIDTVIRAQRGDQRAVDELIGGHLTLVYNIVGRALGGHSDTDDVVQETMLRAVDGLPGLREPGSFRSWLVAIAMNQVRKRHREQVLRLDHAASRDGWPDEDDTADPGADFVDLTIVRLGLSGQRREVAEATRWLDDGDRELLSLWWLEAAGEITRSDLAEAMELTPQHAAVRVQRMKAQLEAARVVVRALAARPPCRALAEIVAPWDGAPSALWRKRIARHARECETCLGHFRDLLPAEGLLVGLALLPLPDSISYVPQAASVQPGRPHPTSHRGTRAVRHRPPSGGRVSTVAVGSVALTAAVVGAVTIEQVLQPHTTAQAAQSPLPVVPSPTTDAPTTPIPTTAPATTPATSKPATTSPTPTHTASSWQQQVLDLVNIQRAQAGCKPVHASSLLQLAAQRMSDEMAARNFFDHTDPDGVGPSGRIDAAGYKWSTWGENIARGQATPASVMKSWMNSPGHRANILNCSFTDLGVGIHQGSGGPWWTQDFGAPE